MVPETAQQLAWHKGRDNPNQEDWREAAEFVARHRKKRQQLGLRPWPYE
jgi:Mg-chelatase subunit ChlI